MVKGLVIRAVAYKDADAILTVLSEEAGKISVRARGAMRKNSKLRAASQLFAYSSMSLFQRSGRFSLNEADVIQQFHGLTRNLDSMALASYFAEVLGTEAEEDLVHPDILRLALNAFYALDRGMYAGAAIKAAFELRYMALSGYMPQLDTCSGCGSPLQAGWFASGLGTATCGQCPRPGPALMLDASALKAARYIISAPVNRVFSFKTGGDSLALLGDMSEKYLLACMERGFKTLEFYKAISV